MSINKVVISGNLTRDSDLRSTASGMSVLGFGVAVNDRRKNQQTGQWEDYPNYIDCTLFGARADGLHPYLVKGTKVAIEGKLRWSQWERDGQKRSKIEVIVDEIEFMSRGGQQGGAARSAAQQPQVAQAAQQPHYAQPAAPVPTFDASSSVYDEDIPF